MCDESGECCAADFFHTYLTLEAAAGGQGVAIAPEPFIADELEMLAPQPS
jgi:DNA-binding transcriptional LysR family regulator